MVCQRNLPETKCYDLNVSAASSPVTVDRCQFIPHSNGMEDWQNECRWAWLRDWGTMYLFSFFCRAFCSSRLMSISSKRQSSQNEKTKLNDRTGIIIRIHRAKTNGFIGVQTPIQNIWKMASNSLHNHWCYWVNVLEKSSVNVHLIHSVQGITLLSTHSLHSLFSWLK